MSDAFEKMNRLYRHQRYFYDLTRKYYLIGRDQLLAKMPVQPEDNVLELGCGTARNLTILAKKHPDANFFGLDASTEMLKTARAQIDRQKLTNIRLATALANDFSFGATFDLPEKFDAAFFSYAISIIPSWRESIINALENLKAGKSLYIVDFYDQKNLPLWFRRLLSAWLRQFHVKCPKSLLPFLEDLERQNVGKLSVKPIARHYALIAELRKN